MLLFDVSSTMKWLIIIISSVLIAWLICKICDITISFGKDPSLVDGETVLLKQKRILLASGGSWPNYRVFFAIPLLLEYDLYISNKRVIHSCRILVFLKQESSQWFSKEASMKGDVIRDVTARKNWLGNYLDIKSDFSPRPWYRSTEGNIRVYTKKAELLCNTICEEMMNEPPSTVNHENK